MKPRRIILSWSSGKDSAWTLHQLSGEPDTEVVALLTSFNEKANRVSMHAVRRELVEAQAAALDLPLWPVLLPGPCPNEIYEHEMHRAIARARGEHITHIAFGDLFLMDIREYRVRQLMGSGVDPLFPLWGDPSETPELARRMIRGGVRAVLTCVDTQQLSESFLGRTFDASLLEALPPGVDPCGERGESHTFCFGGPMFRSEIAVVTGEIVRSGPFSFLDLRPAGPGDCSMSASRRAKEEILALDTHCGLPPSLSICSNREQ